MSRTPPRFLRRNICFRVALLLLLGLDVAAAQQLPPSSGSLPTLRRGPDGRIEAVPNESPSPAAQPSPTAPPTAPVTQQRAPTVPPRDSTARPPATKTPPQNSPTPPVLEANIHNALGWAMDHTYAVGARVNAGPGYSPTTSPGGGKYTSGLSVYAWQATAVTGPSSSSGSGPAIPNGSTCAASAAIQDSGVTWKCLSQTDYLTMHAWAADAQLWAPGITIHAFERRRNGERIYAAILSDCKPGNPSGCSCVTAGSGPGPTGTRYPITDGTCAWTEACYSTYQSCDNTPGYASGRLIGGTGLAIPTKVVTPASCGAGYCSLGGVGNPPAVLMNGKYIAALWNDRPYNNSTETLPLLLYDHTGQCDGGGEDPTYLPSCRPYNQIVVTSAPGECFCDNRSNPLVFDTANGVSLEDNMQVAGSNVGMLGGNDNRSLFTRLQIRSVKNFPLRQVGGSATFDNLLEGAVYGLSADAGTLCINSVVVTHGTIGVDAMYGNMFINCTIVCPSNDCVVGVAALEVGGFGSNYFYNTAFLGFKHTYACRTYFPNNTYGPGCTVRSGSNNVSSASNAAVGDIRVGGHDWRTDVIPGTKSGVSFADSVVNTANDFRLKAGSPLIGAGGPSLHYAAYDASAISYPPQPWGGLDITALARPQGGNYDVGAWQYSPNSPSKPNTGRRRP
jgi:hypothetical protein